MEHHCPSKYLPLQTFVAMPLLSVSYIHTGKK
jgi:hypothetical protein